MTTSPMYTFETREAIAVDLSVEFGGARIIAGQRNTTVVEVRPMSEGRRADVEAAERTRVQLAGGRLEVRAHKPGRLGALIRPGAVDIVIQLPAGSNVQGNGAYGDFDTEGRLGDCFFKTSYGALHVQEAGALTLHTSAGNISAGRVSGVAEISSSSGDLRIDETGAEANLKTSAGDIRVERALGGVNARTAYGAIRVARAIRGELDLTTSYGEIEVGVAEGTATLLKLRSKHGALRNELIRVDDPAGPEEFLKVHAVSGYGDIRIRRA
ncbi:MAG: DUF4097 family beta strand repeat-containing protein [Candidatus Dormibacteraceae bacterium]